MLIDTYAHEEPHASIFLEREPQNDESDLTLAQIALSAVGTFGNGWLEPLAWELFVVCRDQDSYSHDNCVPPRSHWLLRKEPILPGIRVESFYTIQVLEVVPMLMPERTLDWIAGALKQECPEASRFTPAWRHVWSHAVRVRLPNRLRIIDRESLYIDCYAGVISLPIERVGDEAWVSGPIDEHLIGPPVMLTVSNHDRFLTISLQLFWDLWISDPAGRAQVDAAVERVLAMGRGWRRSED